jgi:hypothetical protein
MMRFRYPLMVIPFLIIFPVLFFTRYFLVVPPVPPRPARSVAPPIATPVNPPVTRPR